MAWLKDRNSVARSAATLDKLALSDDLASSLAAELESHSCPICFDLMKSPTNSPMLLSPCGHTFCAKCLAVHTRGNSTCPFCRQRIVSQTLNLSLQKLTENLVALQSTRPLDRDGLPEKLEGAETRWNILRTELEETLELKEDMEVALQEVDERLNNLHNRDIELSDMVNAIHLTQQEVQREKEDTGISRHAILRKKEVITAKIDLIEATLMALERDCDKFKLLLHTRDSISANHHKT